MARVIMSLVCTVVSFIALMVFVPVVRKAGTKGGRMVEDAKNAGRTAMGMLVSQNYRPDHHLDGKNPYRLDQWDVTYEYEAEGQSWQFRGLMEFPLKSPPDTIQLYYEPGQPQNACPEGYGRYKAQGGTYKFLSALPALLFLLFYFFVFK